MNNKPSKQVYKPKSYGENTAGKMAGVRLGIEV